MVGESNDHYYTSYQVAQYLKEQGYKVYPVNPTITDVDGEKSYPSLAEVPEPGVPGPSRRRYYCRRGQDALDPTRRPDRRRGAGASGAGGRAAGGVQPL